MLPTPCRARWNSDVWLERSDESPIAGAPWIRSVLYYSPASSPKNSTFMVKLYFEDGCSVLQGNIEGDDPYKDKEQAFLRWLTFFSGITVG
jgi:hypothetical protein